MSSATDTAPAKTDAPTAAAPAKKKGGKKKKLLILVLLLVVAGAAAYFLMPKGKPEKPPPPPPGPVLKLESITLNLADGHFLKLGLALEFKAGDAAHGGTEPDGSAALDIAIDQFSNLDIKELNSAEARHKAKEHLTEEIKHAYHDAVAKVYFTEFVMQ